MTDPVPGAGISDEDIASVQEAQQEMMPELVTVWDRVEVKDQRGGTKIVYSERAQRVIGRVGRVRDNVLVAFANQLRGKATAMLTVPVDSGVAQQMRVTVLGGLYNVVADLSKSSYSTASRYLIEEV